MGGVPLPGDFSRGLEARKVTTQHHIGSRHQADSFQPTNFSSFLYHLVPVHLTSINLSLDISGLQERFLHPPLMTNATDPTS